MRRAESLPRRWGEARRIEALRDRPMARLDAAIPGLRVNGSMRARIPGNLNLTVPGATTAELMARIPAVCVSTGSACSSAAIEPSYVLRALGLSEEEAGRTLRVGIGRFTSAPEIDSGAAAFTAADAAASVFAGA